MMRLERERYQGFNDDVDGISARFPAHKAAKMMMRPSSRVDGAHSDGIWAASWNGDVIYTAALDGIASAWDTNLARKCSTQEQRLGLLSVVPASDNSFFVTSCQDSSIRFFNTADGSEIGPHIDPGTMEAWTICMSPDDRVVAGGSHKGVINIWSVENRSAVTSFETQSSFLTSVAFSPDGTKLAGAGIDGIVHVFDLATRQQLHRLEAHRMPIRSIQFSPDGKKIFTGSDDRRVHIYDTNRGALVNAFSGHTGFVLCVAGSPNSALLVSGGSDATVKLWDQRMQECLHTYDSQHRDKVWAVDFNSDGSAFISAGDDGLLQMYQSTA